MDTSRGIIFSAILGLLAIGFLSVYINYSSDLSSKRAQLEEYTRTMEGLKEDLSNKTALLDRTMSQLAALQKHADSFHKLNNDKQLASKHIAELEESRKNILRDFMEIVRKVRASSEGMELATLTLNSGQVLQGIKLQKFTDTTVSLSHSNGLMRIEGKDLPEELKERFRYGMEPTISEASPALSFASPSPVNPTPKNGTPASHLQIELDALEQKIIQLEKSKLEWSNVASAHRNQASNAQIAGRPSYTSRAQAAQADQNVQTINQQISRLQQDQVEIRKRITNAMALP